MLFERLADVEKAFCSGSYISTQSLVQTRNIFIKKLGCDHRKLHVAPSNATIIKWVAKFRGTLPEGDNLGGNEVRKRCSRAVLLRRRAWSDANCERAALLEHRPEDVLEGN